MQKPCSSSFFFFQAEDGIRDVAVTGVQTCALPICLIPVNQQIKSSSDEMPFSANYRASGVLVHVTTLPSPHGIGDLGPAAISRSEEHTSELQSRLHLVCRLLLEKNNQHIHRTTPL